jgi:uncharacterized protein (TIGR03000 family)
MITRIFITRIFAVLVLLIPAAAWADEFLAPPGSAAAPLVAGPTYGPAYGPYVGPAYNPYCYTYEGPRHWIYGYFPNYDMSLDRYGVNYGVGNYGVGNYGVGNYGRYYGGVDPYRRYDGPNAPYGLKHYEGRPTLEPAVPYSDYLQHLRTRAQAAQAAIPTPPTLPTPNVAESSADRATLEFSLPTDLAKLWLDDQPIEGEGKVRTFQTPALKSGVDYRFKVKVTWPSPNPFEDNSKEEIVTFRAGERKHVEIRGKN